MQESTSKFLQFFQNRIGLQFKFFAFTSLVLGILLSVLSFFIYTNQKRSLIRETDKQMYSHLHNLIKLLELSHQEREQMLSRSKVALWKLMRANGGLTEGDSTIVVAAQNFLTGSHMDLSVKQWLLNGEQVQGDPIGELVPDLHEITGGYFTIFQRLENDFLALQTNVIDENGKRSSNMLIPHAGAGIFNQIIQGQEVKARMEIVGEQMLTCWGPIYIGSEVKGAYFIGIPDNSIRSMAASFRDMSYYKTGYPYLFNTAGNYLLHPSDIGKPVLHLANLDSIGVLQQDGESKMAYAHNDNGLLREKIMYYQYFEPMDLYAAASVDVAEAITKPLETLRTTITISFLACLIISLTAIYWIVSTIVSPIKALDEHLKQLSLGRTDLPLNIDRKDEIGDMAKSAEKVKQAFNGAAAFAKQIGTGNYDTDFRPLSGHDTLGNSLLGMKDALQAAATAESQRHWTNEGLSLFNQVLRDYSHSTGEMAEKLISELVNYLQANQGAIYTLFEEEGEDPYLQIRACYAWGRKKMREQKIRMGEGLAGQAWLEKKSVYLQQAPENYLSIRSGLGDASPRFILIVPLIINEHVLGVIELASFKKYEEHQRAFLEKLCEDIAASLSMMRTNSKTRKLLEQTQEMTEAIRAQEEEMRQNVEELQATHEEMNRREQELQHQIDELSTENEHLRASISEQGKQGG